MDNTKAFEYGYSFGSSLVDFEQGKKQMRSKIEKEKINPLLDKLDRKIRNKEETNVQKAKRDERLDKVVEKKKTIYEKWKENSKDEYLYSIILGIFFLFISILFLFADMVLLAEIIGELFDLNIATESGKGVAELFYQEPLKALNQFPELLPMSLSVLLMGFYLKVLSDTLMEYKQPFIELSKSKKVFYIVDVIGGVLSFLVLLVMAYTRYKTPFSDDGEVKTYVQLLSAILGFSLPYISAVFFLKGYRKLKNEFKLIRASLDLWFWNLLRTDSRSSVEKGKSDLFALNEKKKDIEQTKKEQEIDALTLHFTKGYNKALDDLLDVNQGPVYDKLRTLLLRKTITDNQTL